VKRIFYFVSGDFVGQNQSQLDMEKIATEKPGSDRMERGSVMRLVTVDTVLIDFVDADYDVYGCVRTHQLRWNPAGVARL
jgi:hypothetical protein